MLQGRSFCAAREAVPVESQSFFLRLPACIFTVFAIIGKSRFGNAPEGREALRTAGQETGGTVFVRL